MGRGITAGIYLGFELASRMKNDFSDEFLACYDLACEERNLYIIKEAFFLANFKNFLEEFNHFFEIEHIGFDTRELTLNDIPDFKTMEAFNDFWDKTERNGTIPFTCNCHFDSVTGIPRLTWLFYDGTYKADFEDYYSIYHFEKAVQVAIKNPLGKLVKLGLYG